MATSGTTACSKRCALFTQQSAADLMVQQFSLHLSGFFDINNNGESVPRTPLQDGTQATRQ
jgi:hypothetical protein